MKQVWWLIGLLLLSACSMPPSRDAGTAGPAGVLLAQADEMAAVGDLDQAIALLERAVRVEPRNGHAWLRLAKIHQDAGDSVKAEQFARRALQFAGTDRQLANESQQLINDIK